MTCYRAKVTGADPRSDPMTDVLMILVAWCVLSVPVGILIGKVIAEGNRDD